ncbi:tail fiber assembly protein [Erwinia aphidicola]|nr:tail fiber assembly protein [Erwinia aphidicola]
MYFYSAKNNAFYPDVLRDEYEQAGSWPDDLVEISDEGYDALFAGQSDGKVITPGDDGHPTLIDPPPLTDQQLVAQANALVKSLMASATTAIAPLQYAVDLEMATDEEQARLKKWKKYLVLLSRVDTTKAPDIDLPEKPE